jgi:hypothetical protein
VRTKPVRFFILACSGMIFAMTSEQKTLIRFDPPDPSFAIVNDRVSFTTEGSERVVSVHGIIFAHFDITDRPAAAYAMVSLIESGYASQAEVSRAFQVSAPDYPPVSGTARERRTDGNSSARRAPGRARA